MAPFGVTDQHPAALDRVAAPPAAGEHTPLHARPPSPLRPAADTAFASRHAHLAEPIRAARGFTLGILFSLPVWAGAAALLWVNL